MPGIVGLITRLPRESAEQQLQRMLGVVRHDPCCSSGTWIDEEPGVYVGWTARKNSFADGMPLRNERGDVTLVFSGEEYPDPSTCGRLKQSGHTVGENDNSHLVHVLEEDPAFPAALNGRFHGFVIDRRRGAATLFNDRYGIHRVYYHQSKDAFYFAGEAKAILSVRPELRQIDYRSMGELVACGCVLENRTLFQGVHVLPAASAWTFRNALLEKRDNYFEPSDWEAVDPLQPEEYYQELRDVFTRNLPRYLAGRQRIGFSLTGGLDTRMILAWHKASAGSLPCYSFGSMFRDNQDVVQARRVAQACGQPHEVITVGKKFLSRFPHYAERSVYLTDGCTDVSHSPDLYVNEIAAKIAPVRMTGNYGGEVLRRVRAFKPVQPTAGLYRPDFLAHVDTAAATYVGLVRGHPLSFALFRQTPWHHFGLLALEQTQLTLRSPYLDNDFARTVFRAPQSSLQNNDVCLRLISEGNAELGHIRTDRGLGGNRGPVRRWISRQYLEFTFKAEYAYDYGMPQWVARTDRMFSPLHLERLFLGRHKFYHFRYWYRDAFAEYVQDMLLDSRALSRSYINRPQVENIVRRHVTGTGNHTTDIHKLLTLELVHRLFLDQQ